MDKDISKMVELAGNRGKYQIYVVGIIFLIWVNTSVINYSLGFLEVNPKVSYTVYGSDGNSVKESKTDVTLTYDICDKVDRNDPNQYKVEKKFGYSIITAFNDGTECNKLKVSLIGTFNSIGLLAGNLFFHPISQAMKMKRFLVFFHIAFTIIICCGSAWANYFYFQVINVLIMFLTKALLNGSLVFNNELSDKKLKAILSGLINSGMGIGGMFYDLMTYLFQNWRYVFIVSGVISLITVFLLQFGFYDSLTESLLDKDYDKFMNILRKIAKRNGREKEFEEGLKTPEYAEIIEHLKAYTIDDEENVKKIGDANKIEDKNEKCEIEPDLNNPDLIEVQSSNAQTKKSLGKIKTEVEGGGGVEENRENLENRKNPEDKTNRKLIEINVENNSNENLENKNENNKNSQKQFKIPQKPKGNCLDLVRYRSVRYIFLLICLFWFCNASLFYGLVIGIKNLSGSKFRNTALLYLCDFFAYNISGFVSNSKIGRKGSLQIFTVCYGVFCLIIFICFKTTPVVLTFYFCSRFSMMTAFCTYYTFAFESYPLSVANIGYAVNAGANSVAGIVVPFIIEYIEDRYVFLIYGILGVMCFGLLFIVPETKGRVIPDNIKEVEEKQKSQTNNVEIKQNENDINNNK